MNFYCKAVFVEVGRVESESKLDWDLSESAIVFKEVGKCVSQSEERKR